MILNYPIYTPPDEQLLITRTPKFPYSMVVCLPKKYIAQKIKMTPKDQPIIPEYGNEFLKTVPPKGPNPLKPTHTAPIILFLGILFN